MILQSYLYMDDVEVFPEPHQEFKLNTTTHIIEIRNSGKLVELVPLSNIRLMVPKDSPLPPRICNRCRRPTSTTPCHHCEGLK